MKRVRAGLPAKMTEARTHTCSVWKSRAADRADGEVSGGPGSSSKVSTELCGLAGRP